MTALITRVKLKRTDVQSEQNTLMNGQTAGESHGEEEMKTQMS